MGINGDSLSSRAMLASLSIGLWRRYRRDKQVTQDTAARYGAVKRAGNYNKNLLPLDEGNEYQEILSAVNAAYDHFREQTLPWLDDGTRILTAANYLGCMEILRRDRAAFEGAVAAFEAALPSLAEKARAKLGTMFREDDYPSLEEVAKRFEFSIRVFPLPAAEDFRAHLDSDTVGQLKDQILRDTQEMVAAAVKDVYGRALEHVRRIRTLVSGDGMVRQATMANLRELCDLLPRLNLTGDEKLAQIAETIKTELASHDAESLGRKHRGRRKRVEESAARIESDLAAFMGR